MALSLDDLLPPENTEQPLLKTLYRTVRQASETLCAPLEIDDYGIQTMADISPPKWHLAHTSWFFETFLLKPFLSGYREYHPDYVRLFNSYYEQVGLYHPRPERGFLSRPTVEQIFDYRAHVDTAMQQLIDSGGAETNPQIRERIITGLNHEQQHQELLLTDIKHILGRNPLRPAYHSMEYPAGNPAETRWIVFDAGLRKQGTNSAGFAFDNERPEHDTWVPAFRLASQPVTNAEYIAFIEDGGYRRPEFWLAEGWKAIKDKQFELPLYWEQRDGAWWHYTLAGMQPVNPHAPVCHVNYFEADAFAAWAGKRLPTEAEWETAAADLPVEGNLRDTGYLQPVTATPAANGLNSLYGDVWEWTRSAYGPYPGYRHAAGALGEYNGKFMCGQYVLRGGSCVTPTDHIRATYRNFFYPADQWQFSGLRLAEDL